jgi:outer membrane murein-binding lipoprotein Lpp
MRRLVWLLLPVLLVAGCRGEAKPSQPGVDQQVSDVESTLDAIESDMAGD